MAKATYRSAVRSFDHTRLASLDSYQRVREALSDLSNEAGQQLDYTLSELLDAVADMTLTAPFADVCRACRGPRYSDSVSMTFPHLVVREGDGLTCTYRCPDHGAWTRGYSVTIAEYR
jgi:hypothetical protein